MTGGPGRDRQKYSPLTITGSLISTRLASRAGDIMHNLPYHSFPNNTLPTYHTGGAQMARDRVMGRGDKKGGTTLTPLDTEGRLLGNLLAGAAIGVRKIRRDGRICFFTRILRERVQLLLIHLVGTGPHF